MTLSGLSSSAAPISLRHSNSFSSPSASWGLETSPFESVPEADLAIRDAFKSMSELPVVSAERFSHQTMAQAVPKDAQAEALCENILERLENHSVEINEAPLLDSQYLAAHEVGAEVDYQLFFEDRISASSFQYAMLFLNNVHEQHPNAEKFFSLISVFARNEAGIEQVFSAVMFDNLFHDGPTASPSQGDTFVNISMSGADFLDYLSMRKDSVAMITPSLSTKIQTFDDIHSYDAMSEHITMMLFDTPIQGLQIDQVEFIYANAQTSPALPSNDAGGIHV